MENLGPYFGILSECAVLAGFGSVLLLLFVGFFGSPLIVWTLAIAALLFGWGAPLWAFIVLAVFYIVFQLPFIRRYVFSAPVMKVLGPAMPKISPTERSALEAGVVWVEQDLFSGKPDLKKLMKESYPSLTAEEQAFMDGPVDKLCEMIDTWKIWKTREMDESLWAFIKKEKFLGMIIPKEYGGLGFSALAHSEVVMKVASRSIPACISIMVPNSLGPAELLAHYGTDAQKKKLLPLLASGEEMPCFGLTEPGAGSDAGAITSSGELFKDTDGKIKIKLNWNKRWITLAAISTTIGLAFRLYDRQNLLGKGEDLGITVALVPSKLPGVVLGKRHDPLGVPFYNCPTQGKDVVVDAEEAIVGGLQNAGKGWGMLMECLAAGRGISLPSQATGGSKLAARAVSAHAVVRNQFGVSIGKIEGVEEPLARIGGYTYALEAMRRYTLGAIDRGIKPGVVTAMSKYYSTEMGRTVINDSMDILGGAAISMGPRNLLAEIYVATPIGITVEGANIMTRTLMVFGQGALRAHPYAFKEVQAIDDKDLAAFDMAFCGHVGHIIRNTCRSILLSVTRGYLASAPVHPELKLYARRLAWASASFAILTDLGMGTLAGTLKFRGKITGRFADILAWMYISTAVMRRVEAEGGKSEDIAFAKYVLKHALAEIQKAFDGIFDNMYGFKTKGIGQKLTFGTLHFVFKTVLGSWSRINSIGSQASDHLQHVLCGYMLTQSEVRNRLVEGIYIPKSNDQQLTRLENAMGLVLKAESIEAKVYKARKAGALPRLKGAALMEAAREKSVISADEYATLKKAQDARWEAIQVDDFTQAAYIANHT